MNELIKKLYEIKVDKYLHFICGMIMAEISFAIIVHFLPILAAMAIAFAITTVIGAGKELIYDKKYGVPNKYDFIATEVGAVLGLLIMFI